MRTIPKLDDERVTVLRRRVRIVKGLHAEFEFDLESMAYSVTWNPRQRPGPINGKVLRHYRVQRNEFLRVVADAIGSGITVIDPDTATAVLPGERGRTQ